MYQLHLSHLQISYNLLKYIWSKPLALNALRVVSDGFSIYLFNKILKEAGSLKEKTNLNINLS